MKDSEGTDGVHPTQHGLGGYSPEEDAHIPGGEHKMNMSEQTINSFICCNVRAFLDASVYTLSSTDISHLQGAE